MRNSYEAEKRAFETERDEIGEKITKLKNATAILGEESEDIKGLLSQLIQAWQYYRQFFLEELEAIAEQSTH